ncbi:hypothetical protein B484DRAFT_441097 [Ochromonadaceae sp. CCMP2298]|nr:hypothetical protein B484DRAFT_441097 [Ochromonadaceae sp. CCMP2298]
MGGGMGGMGTGLDLDLEAERAVYQRRLHMHQRISELAGLKRYAYRKLMLEPAPAPNARTFPPDSDPGYVFVDSLWLEGLLHDFSRCEDWARLLSCSRQYAHTHPGAHTNAHTNAHTAHTNAHTNGAGTGLAVTPPRPRSASHTRPRTAN